MTIIVLPTWIKEDGLGGGLGNEDTGTSVSLNRHTIFLFLLIIAAAFAISILYLIIVSILTKVAIHVTLVLSFLLNVSSLFSKAFTLGDAIYFALSKGWYLCLLLGYKIFL